MIKLDKSTPAPAALDVAAPTNAAAIDGTVYGSPAVKQQLKDDQHGKCAYCERKLNGDYGDVEHYRPKTKYKAADGQKEHDGYHWLAYDWDNLLFSCSECNRSCKRTLFPLYDEGQRDIGHQNIANEQPLLVNPAFERPEDFIGWRGEIAVAVGSTPYDIQKGETTISVLKLNDRPDLKARRLEVLKDYKQLHSILELCSRVGTVPAEIQEAKRLLEDKLADMTRGDKEFAGMLRHQVPPTISATT